jgi:hypothetical protein
MLIQPKDLIGFWSGLIVHPKGATQVYIHVDKVQADGLLHGTYSFPYSNPKEPGGELTGELFGPFLFIRLSDGDIHGKIRFHINIIGDNSPEMMYGTIPRKDNKTSHSTVTVFPARKAPNQITILGAWQKFFVKGQ